MTATVSFPILITAEPLNGLITEKRTNTLGFLGEVLLCSFSQRSLIFTKVKIHVYCLVMNKAFNKEGL